MSTFAMYAPLDPECPDVAEFHEGDDDPISRESGCWGEITNDFERRHRKVCKRCQEYGAANIDVVEAGGF